MAVVKVRRVQQIKHYVLCVCVCVCPFVCTCVCVYITVCGFKLGEIILFAEIGWHGDPMK